MHYNLLGYTSHPLNITNQYPICIYIYIYTNHLFNKSQSSYPIHGMVFQDPPVPGEAPSSDPQRNAAGSARLRLPATALAMSKCQPKSWENADKMGFS